MTATWASASHLCFLLMSFGKTTMERLFCSADGLADVLVVSGILEQTVWKGWMLMVHIPSKLFGKVME